MKNIQCENCSSEISRKAPACPKCGHPNKVAKHLSGWEILMGLGVALGGIFWMASSDTGTTSTTADTKATSTKEPDLKSAAISKIELKDLRPGTDGFSMEVSVTFINKGQRDVKDIEIKCEHFSNSGTHIDTNKRTIYEIIPAGKSKSIKKFSMGLIHSQAAKTICRISDLVVI